MNNFEMIKNMTLSEMAEWMYENDGCRSCAYQYINCNAFKCKEGHRQWLQQESEDNQRGASMTRKIKRSECPHGGIDCAWCTEECE